MGKKVCRSHSSGIDGDRGELNNIQRQRMKLILQNYFCNIGWQFSSDAEGIQFVPVSETILDQNVEHFELTGETLLKYSDEVCKAMHLQYRIFDFEHRYVDNNKNSDTHLEMQQKSMVHFNSLNLGDVWIYSEIHLN